MHLTLEEWNALPTISGNRMAREISAVHLHAHLPRAPATVVVDGTHYRVSRHTKRLAVDAFLSAGSRPPPAPGRLVDMLRAMGTGDVDVATSVGDAEPDAEPDAGLPDAPGAPSDPLDLLAERLAREALEGLQVATRAAVSRIFAERRGALIEEAVRALSALD